MPDLSKKDLQGLPPKALLRIREEVNGILADAGLGDGGLDAEDVAIADAGTLFDADNVEDALAEVKAIADSGVGLVARTVTIGHAALTSEVNGEAMAINIGAVLPENALVLAHAITDITPFSGGSVSECVLDVGGTDVDGIVNALELITDAPTEAELAAARGILPQGYYSEQQLVATITPDPGHRPTDPPAVR